MIRSRPGSGSPASVFSGMASAAATDTAPRIPVKATSRTSTHGGPSARPSRARGAGGAPRTRTSTRSAPRRPSPRPRAPSPDQRAERRAVDALDDRRQLQPDEHEQRRVEGEDDDLPGRVGLQARGGATSSGRPPAQVRPARDGGQHGRDPERLGRQVGQVGASAARSRSRSARPRRRRRTCATTSADHEPDRDAADGVDDELAAAPRAARTPARPPRRRRTCRRSGAVASLTRLSPSTIVTKRRGRAEPRGDRGRRDRVGRRDDRAEHERRRPRSPATSCATTATPTVVAITSPIASSQIGAHVVAQVAQRA